MVFSTVIFLFYFLPIVLTLYFGLPRRLRNLVLLVASLFFYIWGEPIYAWVMLLSICLNYGFGLMVDSTRERPKRVRWVLIAAVAVNLGLLGFFKYANFGVETLNNLLMGMGISGFQPIHLPKIALPIGISFFTFHAMSYVFDIHRGKSPVQKNPFDLALYIVFFPQLIAGPIVRYHDIADQLRQRQVTTEKFTAGIRRFVIGLAKKTLIANTVALAADQIFALDTAQIGGGLAWLGILCYTIQIFFDFSGYSDMAIGLALLFGFQFPENFNTPYAARSVQDFWRRWHITLSTWFRDYLYIPLGGNLKGTARTYLNLYIVFFLTGLWHGASWNFVIWGLLHGTFLVIERLGFDKILARIGRVGQHVYTLLVVMIAWVFFRAETLPQAISYLSRMFNFSSFATENPIHPVALYIDSHLLLMLALGIIFSFPVVPAIKSWIETTLSPRFKPFIMQDAVPVSVFQMLSTFVLLMLSAMSLAVNTYNPFIYFRF